MPQSHVVDYTIYGDDLQFVEVELDPNETVIAEAGVMMYMEAGVAFESRMGDGSKPKSGLMDKLFSAGKRLVTGESIFMTHFTHSGGAGKKHVAFAAPYPGKIIAIDLDETQGELRGDGMVFIHAGGTIIEKRLENEKLLVDTGCIVAFESHISYDIEQAGNLKSMLFGGEGLFLATLQGTGRVWLQSLPFSRLADRILQNAPSRGGQSTGEGSVIKGLSKFMGQ